MDLSGFAGASKGQPAPPPDTFTAVVVRADESGLWVAPVGEDTRHPVGPCRGGWTANGTRVPSGAVVMLVHTPDGPWVVGVDNPALAISDGTLAPFQNPSFELPGDNSVGAQGWGSFGLFGYAGAIELITAQGAAHGQRHIRSTRDAGTLFLQSSSWTVVAGSSFETGFYARRVSGQPRITAYLYSTPPGTGDPGLFNANAVLTIGAIQVPTNDWLRYRDTITPPATHTRLALVLRVDSADGNPAVVELDNTDADLVNLDPAAANQDYMRRAAATLTGGGIRTATAGGNVAWTQPLTIAGAGLGVDVAPEGRFEISMPGNGVVIPVHHSPSRTSVTVTGGAVLLEADEALWYEAPVGQPAASQPGRFNVLASALDDGYAVPAHWVLVVRRTSWSSTAHAPEYLWGDGQLQDPWRTPSLNAGWVAGTATPRFTKSAGGTVRLAGRVKDGAGSAFTLPIGYRPAEAHDDVVRDGAGSPALITVTTGGVVTTAGSNTDHSINTTFVAGQ